MRQYKCLVENEFVLNEFKIVPIRFEDRLDIMKWRNEQIYHLRQAKPLTLEDQNAYFEHVVSKLFEQEKPQQLLFSFLKDDVCIGYGGLVHINWIDKHAEISFIMNTELEKSHFEEYWSIFLILLDKLAFSELKFHKMTTYAYDLRPHIYEVFERNGFTKEGTLKEHKLIDDMYIDVVIHAKINRKS